MKHSTLWKQDTLSSKGRLRKWTHAALHGKREKSTFRSTNNTAGGGGQAGNSELHSHSKTSPTFGHLAQQQCSPCSQCFAVDHLWLFLSSLTTPIYRLPIKIASRYHYTAYYVTHYMLTILKTHFSEPSHSQPYFFHTHLPPPPSTVMKRMLSFTQQVMFNYFCKCYLQKNLALQS